MRRFKEILWAFAALALIVGTMLAATMQIANADLASGPSLIISQIKITSSNGQFITLYNSGNSVLDMSKYQLEYFNNFDLSKSTSSRLIGLSGSLAPHSYYMVNDDNLLLCYKMTINSVSLGFSSTAGMVQVLGLSQTSSGGFVAPILEDYVGWSKTTSAGAQTLPGNSAASLLRRPIDASNNPLISNAGAGSWLAVQPDSTNPCNLISSTSSNSSITLPSTASSALLPPTEPPVTIINVIESGVSNMQSQNLPAVDIGLMAPEITEILPNPLGSGNDTTQEFIELYNPNPVAFDLSGFALQSGTTNPKNYYFAPGAMLPPLGFIAYYSSKTNLNLANTSGQVRLLDPSGNFISVTGQYSSAKDGQSWALAQAKWHWTTDVTPGLANIIRQQITPKTIATTKAKGSSTNSSKTTSKAVKKTKTAKPKAKPKAKKTKKTVTKTNQSNASDKTPIHFGALAIIGGLALLYVAYEYRADIGNYYFQFRSNIRTWRKNRA